VRTGPAPGSKQGWTTTSPSYADHEVVHLMGGVMPVTSAARTAVDVARETDRFECAVAVFDSALRHGATREELAAALGRARSWPGARLASGALPLADGRADNPGESWSRVVLIGLGLPPDDLQVRLVDAQGLIGYVDFGWDDVIGEFDGKLKYGVDEETDRERPAGSCSHRSSARTGSVGSATAWPAGAGRSSIGRRSSGSECTRPASRAAGGVARPG
jgi:hypothetical protein